MIKSNPSHVMFTEDEETVMVSFAWQKPVGVEGVKLSCDVLMTAAEFAASCDSEFHIVPPDELESQ